MPLRRAVVTLAVTAALVLSLDRLASGDDGPPPPVPTPAPDSAVVASRPAIPIAVRTDERVVALSFDDGPDPRWTPAVLDALAAAGVRATFFATGEHARAHPELLQATAAAGHEVANHTDTHPPIDELTAPAVTDQVERAEAAIASTGVVAVPLFRPPKGRYDAEALAGVAPTGLQTIGWTVCLERWLRRGGPALGVEETVARVRPGGIIVAHDGGLPDRAATVAALPHLLARLAQAGYRVVPVGELLLLGPTVRGLPGDAGPPPILFR